jgi:LPXTG-motif cell wall-anchored protein
VFAFGESLTMSTAAGAALIVLSTFYLARRR